MVVFPCIRNTFGSGRCLRQVTKQVRSPRCCNFNDSLAVNLPGIHHQQQAGRAFSLTLWNSAATRFIDMEVSALEADGRGKGGVQAPCVMTADKG